MKQKKACLKDDYCLDEKDWLNPKKNKNEAQDNNQEENKARLTATAPGVYFLNFK